MHLFNFSPPPPPSHPRIPPLPHRCHAIGASRASPKCSGQNFVGCSGLQCPNAQRTTFTGAGRGHIQGHWRRHFCGDCLVKYRRAMTCCNEHGQVISMLWRLQRMVSQHSAGSRFHPTGPLSMAICEPAWTSHLRDLLWTGDQISTCKSSVSRPTSRGSFCS